MKTKTKLWLNNLRRFAHRRGFLLDYHKSSASKYELRAVDPVVSKMLGGLCSSHYMDFATKDEVRAELLKHPVCPLAKNRAKKEETKAELQEHPASPLPK
jgi:hypothetical protein